jgi:hypothetical protein
VADSSAQPLLIVVGIGAAIAVLLTVGGVFGEDESNDEAGCKMGAKSLELIGTGIRQGHGLAEAAPELGAACEAAVNVLQTQPDEPVEFEIESPDGSSVTRTITGSEIQVPAPAASTGIGDVAGCLDYRIQVFRQMCLDGDLSPP